MVGDQVQAAEAKRGFTGNSIFRDGRDAFLNQKSSCPAQQIKLSSKFLVIDDTH
jgi:hypothetical protein